jgi:DNA-directed RNA polymerase sigma subunit (sigma70/sigma32)
MTERRRLITAIQRIDELARIQRRLVQDLGREPTPEEIGARMGIPAEEVRLIQKVAQEPVTLEDPIGEEDPILEDFIEDPIEVAPLRQAAFTLLQDQLGSVLHRHQLSEREERVIALRFGLADGRPRTLEEVGRELRLTSEQIRTIESETISKLRSPPRPAPGPRIVPDQHAGHLHGKPLDDFQLRSHLRLRHPRRHDRPVPVDIEELRTMHEELHRQGPPEPA